jgi:hypothetical protein
LHLPNKCMCPNTVWKMVGSDYILRGKKWICARDDDLDYSNFYGPWECQTMPGKSRTQNRLYLTRLRQLSACVGWLCFLTAEHSQWEVDDNNLTALSSNSKQVPEHSWRIRSGGLYIGSISIGIHLG